MAGTLMRLLLLCGGLAMVAPAVVAQDECWEDDCEDRAQELRNAIDGKR